MVNLNSDIVRNTIKAIIVIGYSLCLGSIVSFVAMNGIAGTSPTIEFMYWHRTFISPIMNFVTIPAIWLLLVGAVGLLFVTKKDRKRGAILLLGLSILIIINGYFILKPLADTVNNLAVAQMHTSTYIDGFTNKKSMENICGGINLLLVLIYTGLYTFYVSGPKAQIKSAKDHLS